MAPARVGIKDVARAAGVSPTTVSHALNGKGRMPDETRERVRAVANRLGYRPSAAARNLVEGRTGLLGLVMPSQDDLLFPAGDVAYFAGIAAAATRVAMRAGCGLVIAATGGDGTAPLDRVDVDGAIVVDPVEGDAVVAALGARGVPIVTTGRVPGDDAAPPWVDNDHVAGARLVFDHLAERGATRVALLAAQPDTSFGHDLDIAYAAWCAERGQAPETVRVRSGLTDHAAEEAARRALDAEPGCDAVFATLDRLALATLHEARARGLRVPEELLLVTATDSEAARWSMPPLTVLDLHPDRIGTAATELLVDLVEGREPETRRRLVDCELVERGSTARVVPATP